MSDPLCDLCGCRAHPHRPCHPYDQDGHQARLRYPLTKDHARARTKRARSRPSARRAVKVLVGRKRTKYKLVSRVRDHDSLGAQMGAERGLVLRYVAVLALAPDQPDAMARARGALARWIGRRLAYPDCAADPTLWVELVTDEMARLHEELRVAGALDRRA